MENNMTLKDIAQSANNPVVDNGMSDDTPAIVMVRPDNNIDTNNTANNRPTPKPVGDSSMLDSHMGAMIDVNNIEALLGHISLEEIKNNKSKYIEGHRSNLIMVLQLNPMIADQRANTEINEYIIKRTRKENGEVSIESQPVEENINESSEEKLTTPPVADIIINKVEDSNNLGLTEEEHQKLQVVQKIRLVTISDENLKTIKIEKPSEDLKMDYVRSISSTGSKYSVPLPLLGDFVDFKGAQINQMLNLIKPDDAPLGEVLAAKATLLYEKLLGGKILKKYGEDGKSIMSYNQFANVYPYQDVDMGIYGILCASSVEESKNFFSCEKCGHNQENKYMVKNLLNMDDAPDEYKERVDNILTNRFNSEKLDLLYKEKNGIDRYQSPFSNNIFDLAYPSIAKAANVFATIDQQDAVEMYLAAIALYISSILLYNEERDSYIQIDSSDTRMLINTMKDLSDKDINMIADQVSETLLLYNPRFIYRTKCNKCGHTTEDVFKVEHLIFLKAQDSETTLN